MSTDHTYAPAASGGDDDSSSDLVELFSLLFVCIWTRQVVAGVEEKNWGAGRTHWCWSLEAKDHEIWSSFALHVGVRWLAAWHWMRSHAVDDAKPSRGLPGWWRWHILSLLGENPSKALLHGPEFYNLASYC